MQGLGRGGLGLVDFCDLILGQAHRIVVFSGLILCFYYFSFLQGRTWLPVSQRARNGLYGCYSSIGVGLSTHTQRDLCSLPSAPPFFFTIDKNNHGLGEGGNTIIRLLPFVWKPQSPWGKLDFHPQGIIGSYRPLTPQLGASNPIIATD